MGQGGQVCGHQARVMGDCRPTSITSRYANLALAETANIQGESFRNASIDGGEQPVWVKTGNPRSEQMFSAIHPKPDITRQRRGLFTVRSSHAAYKRTACCNRGGAEWVQFVGDDVGSSPTRPPHSGRAAGSRLMALHADAPDSPCLQQIRTSRRHPKNASKWMGITRPLE